MPLKWGFIPTLRYIDDDLKRNESHSRMDDTSETKGPYIIDETVADSSLNDAASQTKQYQIEERDESKYYEIRDEKGRKWWKFFDDYEYRLNDRDRAQRKWYKWFKDSDTPEERRVILKLDLLLTFYSFMAYWATYLDQTNLNNAYVGGLKQSIGMHGNDLVDTQMLFTVGSIIFLVPFMFVFYAAPLNYVLPACQICWSALTIALCSVTSVSQLKVMRFFIGSFEAPLYLAFQWSFSTWYKADESARRSVFYYFGQYLGVLTSGLLSGSIIQHLDGVSGKAGWKWIFIIDGCMTAAVAIIGFYVMPGTPTRCYSIWLTDDDIRIARARLEKNNTQGNEDIDPRNFFKLDLWKSIIFDWKVYVLSVWDIFLWLNNNGTSGAYILWLQALKKSDGSPRFNGPQVQRMSALTPGLGIVWLILAGLVADQLHQRWLGVVFTQVFNVLGNILLAVWHIPEGAKWFAWCLQYFSWAMAPILFTWEGDITRRDVKERTMVLVIMQTFGQSFSAWTSVIAWKTVNAPRYLAGYTLTAACAFGSLFWTFVVLYFYKKQERSLARENGIILINTENDPQADNRTSSSSVPASDRASSSNERNFIEALDPPQANTSVQL